MTITGGSEGGYSVPRSERRYTVSPRDHLRFVNAAVGMCDQSIDDLTVNTEGAYTIIGVAIKDDNPYSVDKRCTGENARERALAEATQLTGLNINLAGTDVHLATIYFVYDPQGKYIGGNTWKGE